ncbi:MAG: tRNA 2-thiouridine(34) synthase MnmA [Fusobacteriaceae bacterium]
MNIVFDKNNFETRIAVAMSGGVDSSTVAYLLKKQGFDVIGITMRTCKPEDQDAKKVCDDLGIKHFVFDAREEFEKKVINYFVDEYLNGRTPNPCMMCNRHVKFGQLLDFAKSLNAKFMATGHYAKMNDGVLSMGDDPLKDQAYFLSQIKKEYFKDIIFPIGEMEKSNLRVLAEELGVRVYAKKDSQEICFFEDGEIESFLLEKTGGKAKKSGNIIDTKNNILGKHKGIAFYTIGQRKGLGISSPEPLYVIGFDIPKNEIIVGSNEELFKDKIIANQINLLTVNSISELENRKLFAKARSRDTLHECEVKVLGEDKIEVNIINNKVRAVTPGQGIVFYDEEKRVVAGGFIL